MRIIKIVAITFVTLGILLVTPKSEKRNISKDLEVKIYFGKIILNEDTHGGFLGDGLQTTVIKFKNDKFEEKLKIAKNWHKLPLEKSLAEQMVECKHENFGDNFKDILLNPKGEGYYFFKNRFENNYDYKKSSINLPGNYTFAIYDTKKHLLYYYEYDS